MSLLRAGIVLLSVTATLFAQASVNGVVRTWSGTPVPLIEVVLYDTLNWEVAHTAADNAGAYTIPATPGKYGKLMARVYSMITLTTPGIPKEVYYTAETSFTVSGATTKDITLPRYYHISGKVVDDVGTGLAGARLTAKKWLGYEQPPADNCSTETDGSYSLYQEGGGVKIWVTAPAGYSSTEPEFTITSDTVMDIELPRPIAIHGTVRSFAGDPAANVIVCAQWGYNQVDSLSHADGSYSIPMQAGTYKIRLRSNTMNPVVNAPSDFDTTVIESLTVSVDTLLDLTLPQYLRVALLVEDDNGDPVALTSVRSVKGTGIGQLPRDGDSTDADGRCTLFVAPGDNEITITPASGSALFEFIEQYTFASDTDFTITMPRGVKAAGRVLRSDSTPVESITVAFQSYPGPTQYEVMTGSDGSFLKYLQPGMYKLRVRNFACPGNPQGIPLIAGVPCEMEYTHQDSVTLTDSLVGDIVLPYYPVMSGVVSDAAGTPIEGVRIYCKSWQYGAEQPPGHTVYSGSDGSYSLVLGQGINRVWVIPPTSQPTLQSFDFIDNFDSSRTRDLIIPDQARGITRIQPSVISTGVSGSVMINGINVNFTGGTVTVDLGEGVEVSNVDVISDITITADVVVRDTAALGTHDVVVQVGTQAAVGAGLLTITAPASAKVELVGGETVEDVRISDGTGTELLIPAGTAITFPPGSDSTISYIAPLIQGSDTAKPAEGEFTDIQRELWPSGLTVGPGDSIVVTSTYKNQDVEGIDEATLVPFYFIDTAGSSGGTAVGDSMKILDRDTAANTVTFVMEHFSMFRMAAVVQAQTPAPRAVRAAAVKTGILSCPNPVRRGQQVTVHVSARQSGKTASLALYDLRGRQVWAVSQRLSAGTHRLSLPGINDRLPAQGAFVLRFRIGDVAQARRVTLGR